MGWWGQVKETKNSERFIFLNKMSKNKNSNNNLPDRKTHKSKQESKKTGVTERDEDGRVEKMRDNNRKRNI